MGGRADGSGCGVGQWDLAVESAVGSGCGVVLWDLAVESAMGLGCGVGCGIWQWGPVGSGCGVSLWRRAVGSGWRIRLWGRLESQAGGSGWGVRHVPVHRDKSEILAITVGQLRFVAAPVTLLQD